MATTLKDVVKVRIDDEIYERASKRAKLKMTWQDTWKDRSDEARFQNFLDGQLGEEAIKVFLEGKRIEFTYYDDIRTDGFKEKDQYDFKVIDGEGKEIELSVKSSKLKKSVEATIDENNILAYPNRIKPITVQPFIDLANRRVFLLGWATEEELEKTHPQQLRGRFSDRPSITHQVRIRDAHPMSELSEHLRVQK